MSIEASRGPILELIGKRLRESNEKRNKLVTRKEKTESWSEEQEEKLSRLGAVIEELEVLSARISAAVEEDLTSAAVERHERYAQALLTLLRFSEVRLFYPPNPNADQVLESFIHEFRCMKLTNRKENELNKIMTKYGSLFICGDGVNLEEYARVWVQCQVREDQIYPELDSNGECLKRLLRDMCGSEDFNTIIQDERIVAPYWLAKDYRTKCGLFLEDSFGKPSLKPWIKEHQALLWNPACKGVLGSTDGSILHVGALIYFGLGMCLRDDKAKPIKEGIGMAKVLKTINHRKSSEYLEMLGIRYIMEKVNSDECPDLTIYCDNLGTIQMLNGTGWIPNGRTVKLARKIIRMIYRKYLKYPKKSIKIEHRFRELNMVADHLSRMGYRKSKEGVEWFSEIEDKTLDFLLLLDIAYSFTRDSNKQQEETEETTKCKNCGLSGHRRSDCGVPFMIYCFACDDNLHNYTECPFKLRACLLCKSAGHIAQECNNPPKS